MAYFSKDEYVFINSDLFYDFDEGVIVSVPEEDESFYDVRITKTSDGTRVGEVVPLVEDELTKFTDE